MQRIEKLCFKAGYDPGTFMDKAAEGISLAVEEYIYKRYLPKRVMLLVGKGNKAGDAYTAGRLLLGKGFFVHAIRIFPLEGSSQLCLERYEQFIDKGGVVETTFDTKQCSVILDGLVGTGFKGKAEGALKKGIEWALQTKLPILAIDIPSGLNGSTGEVLSVAIEAKETIYLGLPKLGFFIGKGWDHIGDLRCVDIGLPEEFVGKAKEEATLLDRSSLEMPRIQRSRHKYQAGYVLGIGGSPHMPGASALATAGVLRSGAGIVRLFSMEETPTNRLLAEVIHEDYSLKRVMEESKRAAAFFVGPGLGRTEEVEAVLKSLLPKLNLPAVLDADALYFLAKNRSWKIPKNSILSPHHGEMKAFLKKEPTLKLCQEFADRNKTTLILKGAPTVIFHPKLKPLIVAEGDPGMATAGSGDVLTGILAGLLAQKLEPLQAACLGVYLHGVSGETAAAHLTSYCMIASDLLKYLPETVMKFCSNIGTNQQTFESPLPGRPLEKTRELHDFS